LPTGITSNNAAQAISVVGAQGHTIWIDATLGSANGGGVNFFPTGGASAAANSLTFAGNNAISVTSNNTSGSAHPIVPPTAISECVVAVLP